FLAEPVKRLRLQLIDEVEFPAPEPKQLGIAICLNLEPHGVQAGKPRSIRSGLPVIRVSLQKNVLPAPVLGHGEWTENAASWRILARGRDRELVKQQLQTADWSGERERYAARAVRLRRQLARGRSEPLRDPGLEPRRHHSTNRRDDVARP